jgi:hypothetical protein
MAVLEVLVAVGAAVYDPVGHGELPLH